MNLCQSVKFVSKAFPTGWTGLEKNILQNPVPPVKKCTVQTKTPALRKKHPKSLAFWSAVTCHRFVGMNSRHGSHGFSRNESVPIGEIRVKSFSDRMDRIGKKHPAKSCSSCQNCAVSQSGVALRFPPQSKTLRRFQMP